MEKAAKNAATNPYKNFEMIEFNKLRGTIRRV